jgi:transcriptional regulator with XRE-family HTH domain
MSPPFDGGEEMRFEAIDAEGNRLALPVTDFPKWLKKQRKKSGLSLQAVATEFGLVRQAVWSWEQGRAMPTLERLAEIVKFFEAAIGTSTPKAEAPVAEPKKAKKGERLARLSQAEEILGV